MTKMVKSIEDAFRKALNEPAERKPLGLVKMAINHSSLTPELKYVLKECADLMHNYSKYPDGREEALEGMKSIYDFVKPYVGKKQK